MGVRTKAGGESKQSLVALDQLTLQYLADERVLYLGPPDLADATTTLGQYQEAANPIEPSTCMGKIHYILRDLECLASSNQRVFGQSTSRDHPRF